MTPKQEDALLDYLQEVITPLIEQVLVKKLGQAMTFAKQELIQSKREWQDLTDKEVDLIYANSQTTQWAILMAQSTLKEKNT
jgi:hypothetical protein